jgi:PAS domain S-box-containing protein
MPNSESNKNPVKQVEPIRRRKSKYINMDSTERKLVNDGKNAPDAKFRNFLNNLGDVAYETDASGNVTYANKVAEKITGIPSKDIIGKSFLPLFTKESQQVAIKVYKRTLNGENTEYELTFTNGKVCHFKNEPLRDENGQVTGVFGIARDITKRKQVEKMLRDSEERYKNLFNNSLLGLYRTTPNGRILMANPALVGMLGYDSFEELARRNLEDEGYHPEYPRSVFKERISRESKVTGLESAWKRSDGTTLYVRESAQAVRDESGNIMYYEGTVEDITEHRQIAMALHSSEQMFEALVANMSEGVDIVDGNLRCMFANPAGEEIFGVEAGGLVGRTLHEFISEEGHKRIEEQLSKRRKGIASSYDLEIIRPDGRKRQLIVTGTPRFSQDGKYLGALAIFFDVTKRKQAEEALRKAHNELEMRIQERTAELQRANRALQAQIAERIKAEDELKKSKDILQKTFTSLDSAVFILDAKKPPLIIDCNPAAARIFGYGNEEMLGKTTEFLHVSKETLQEFQKALNQSIKKQGGLSFFEFKMRRKDSQVFPSEHSVRSLKDDNGLITGWISVVRDITERKESEGLLRETTDLLETIFEHTHMLVAYLDREFNFVRVNRAYAEADEREPSFFVGKNHFDLYPNEENEEIFRRVVKTGNPYFTYAKPFEYAEHPERGITYWDWSLVPIKQQDGVVFGLVLTLANATEQKSAEQALRESEERFRKVFEESPTGMVLTSRDLKFFGVNPAFCKMLGYTAEEMGNKTFLDVTYPAHHQADRENVEKMWRGEIQHYMTEKRYLTKNGDIRWGSLSTSLIRGQDGRPLYALAMVEDITERKQAENALRESEAKHKSMIELAPDVIVVVNKLGFIVSSNDAAQKVSGYSKDELIGRHFTKLGIFKPRDIPKYLGIFARVLKGTVPEPFEVDFIRKDGGRGIVEVRVNLLEDGSIQTIATDIKERKMAEQALRESEERLKILFESAPDAIYLIDSKGRFVDGNRAAEDLIGFKKTEVIGKSLAEMGLLSAVQLSKAKTNLKKGAAGKLSGPNEYALKRKDGSHVCVEVRTFPVKIGGKILTLGIARDITGHKRTEKKLLEHQAKLKSLASRLSLAEERERYRLATDLHDQISQSLVISKIKLDQLRKLSDSDEFNKSLKDISNCLGQVIDDTRALTFDLSYPILYELGFEAAVAEWLNDQIQVKHGIKTEFTNDGHQKPLDDDIRVLLFRNVRELLINVVKHAQPKKVKVSIRRIKDNVRISVEDDGIGFDPVEVMSMSAKRAEFGLFSVRERLEQLGGLIEIDSEVGRGTKITMTAPLKKEEAIDKV